MWKMFLVASIFVSTLTWAQSESNIKYSVQVDEFTFNLKTGVMVWKGYLTSPATNQKMVCSDCTINFPSRTMCREGECRQFTLEEAEKVSRLLFDVSVRSFGIYAGQSMAWWAEGQGTRLDPDGKPLPSQQDPEQPPSKKSTTTIAAFLAAVL